MFKEIKSLLKGPELVPQQAKEVSLESLPPKVQESIGNLLSNLWYKYEHAMSSTVDKVDHCFDLTENVYKVFTKFEEPNPKKRKLRPTRVTEMVVNGEGEYKSRQLKGLELRRYLKQYGTQERTKQA